MRRTRLALTVILALAVLSMLGCKPAEKSPADATSTSAKAETAATSTPAASDPAAPGATDPAPTDEQQPTAEQPSAEQPPPPAEAAAEPEPTAGKEDSVPPTVDSEALTALARANNQFAFDLYGKLATASAEHNLFFSPFSISSALAMTSAGARGETAQEMRTTLRLAGLGDDVHDAFGALDRSLEPPTGDDGSIPYALRIANRLFGSQSLTFEQPFLDQVQRAYDASLEPMDFEHNADPSREKINAWVEEQTEQKIKDLLKPGVINSNTLLVLVNAIYFKGSWAEPFERQRTTSATFHTASGEEPTVPLMERTGSYAYGSVDGVDVVELPYVGERLAMLVLAPPLGELPALEAKLDAAFVERAVGALQPQQVQLSLPRFTTTGEFELAETLADLGMKLAFEPGTADFSGITTGPIGLSNVVHKAFVEVNEEGTEAAAATGVVATRGLMPEPLTVRIDRPFVFAVRDTQTGSILFLGRIADPR